MISSQFEIDVKYDDAIRFAEISGDWNPLHTDIEYANKTNFKKPVLHGAFSAGLVSRLAGMHLPGQDCLLHGMRLDFLLPIIPPAKLVVRGDLVEGTMDGGKVSVRITDNNDGRSYVRASYSFGRHETATEPRPEDIKPVGGKSEGVTLVTGATGGLGTAVLKRLGSRGVGISRGSHEGMIRVPELDSIDDVVELSRIDGIVHCAWPGLDNTALLETPPAAIESGLSGPLRHCLGLARLLAKNGSPKAPLILIGSTSAEHGSHGYKSPIYSLAKSMVPSLTKILANELSFYDRRCYSIVFDILDGGMSGSIGGMTRVGHIDRSPFGVIPSLEEAAEQILWTLDNKDVLLSGSILSLTGGVLP